MRYLIDTNIFLFYAFDNGLLDSTVRQVLEDYENIIYISSESLKEIIHLFQIGKIKTKKWKTAQDIFYSVEHECFEQIILICYNLRKISEALYG